MRVKVQHESRVIQQAVVPPGNSRHPTQFFIVLPCDWADLLFSSSLSRFIPWLPTPNTTEANFWKNSAQVKFFFSPAEKEKKKCVWGGGFFLLIIGLQCHFFWSLKLRTCKQQGDRGGTSPGFLSVDVRWRLEVRARGRSLLLFP